MEIIYFVPINQHCTLNMFKKSVCLIFSLFIVELSSAQAILDLAAKNKTPEYSQIINYYEQLDSSYSNAKLLTAGASDFGIPLSLFVITNDADFDFESIHRKNKTVLFINNGIHAGEPCGVDACLQWSKDLLSKKEYQNLLSNTVVVIVPFYNIGGAFNRSCCSRANQNGPQEYGFRGNAKNLDLNRDLIKCDASNSRSLIEMIQRCKPHVFIDTHISNGADYQYNMTLIATQHNKLNKQLQTLLNTSFLPQLHTAMQGKNNDFCPYVDTYKATPDSGLVGFLESPRYTTGFTTLHNILGFVTEAHMLKPYPLQVKATYDLLQSFLEVMHKNNSIIISTKNKADADVAQYQKYFPLQWKLDTAQFDMIEFKGFEAGYKKSSISGLNRLYYDRNKPFKKEIRYYNYYTASDSVKKPIAYVIPQAYSHVVQLLQLNGINCAVLQQDSLIETNYYYIENYQTVAKPYEGHYLHNQVVTKSEKSNIQFYKGDYIIYCNQVGNRYIIETLEPTAIDSYFNWNFFDAILQQKEWFSDYVYEEKAEQVLRDMPQLKTALETYVAQNNLQNNHWEQLAWIFKHAPEFEKTAFRYPVFKIE